MWFKTLDRLSKDMHDEKVTLVTIEANSELETISFILNGTERYNNVYKHVKVNNPLIPCVDIKVQGFCRVCGWKVLRLKEEQN